MRKALFIAFLFTLPADVVAHIGVPSVRTIRFVGDGPSRAWVVMENVGLLLEEGPGFRWLCDEAITPLPGLQDLAVTGGDGLRWTAATRNGVFVTEDNGCTFTPVDGVLAEHVIGRVDPHPNRPDEALITTQTLGLPNDVFRTTDGGRTWLPANLALPGRVRALLRSQQEPDVVYITHAVGALRSDDGGQTFSPIALGPAELTVSGIDFELLGTRAGPVEEVFAAVIQFPNAHLVRTRDRGATWETVQIFEDIPDSLVFSRDGRQGLVSFPFDGLYRSDDGGHTWTETATPEDSPWISCLTRAPAEEAIWACARRGNGWLLARSADFGRSWTPRIGYAFREIIGSWACESSSQTSRVCADACDRSLQDCSGADAGVDGPPADPIDMGRDRGGTGEDAHVTGPITRRRPDPSCSQGDSPDSLLFVVLLWGLSRRRRENRI